LLGRFIAFFKRHQLLQPTNHFIIAVSGGIDSVVLAELCYQAQFSFSIAHCNFGLRGEESDRDENFVKSLGKKYGAEVLVQHFNTAVYADEHKISIQEAARVLRYTWFEEIRIEKKASYVLLAHHANDNIETLLMHLFRGTGLQGLTGIPIQSNLVTKGLRPLLQFTRKEIAAFAESNHLQWVEDSSNQSSKYTRNFFRNELIPSIQNVFPQAEQNLLDTIERLKQTESLYTLLVNQLKEKVVQKNNAEVRIPVKKLMHYQHTSFIYEVLKEFQFTEKQVPEIIKLSESESGKYIENDHYRIIKHRAWFIISPKFLPVTETIIIEKDSKKFYLPNGILELEWVSKKNFVLKKSDTLAQLDAADIKFPLLVRRWKEGDYFYPLGMRKKKKLARFFIDQKLSALEKEKIWVLESNNRIVWVIGHRIDDRFKVEPYTQKILQISYSSL
jgi:tRNA(Ile)-lysidine synthase